MRRSTIVELDNAFGLFLRRPCFRRVCTYQELVFGRDIRVCCGDTNVELSLLWGLHQACEGWDLSSVKFLENIKLIDFAVMRNARSLLEYGVTPMFRGGLRQMTMVAGRLQSEDVRDSVFGVLALIDWEGEELIRPDYGKGRYDLDVEVL